MRGVFAVGVFVAGALVLGTSCREPTQITLVLTTDVDCATVTKTSTEIAIGSRAAITGGTSQNVTANTCAGKDIGTLAVVPSGTDDVVAIEVRLSTTSGKLSSACRPGDADCITARRVLSFIPHTPVTLPIDLSIACRGTTCAPLQTCVAGKCVSDTVDTSQCKAGVCGVDTLPPVDGGVVDSGPADVVSSDACTTCPSGCVDLATSLGNCGECGLDCTGGECTNGICRLIPKAKRPDDPNEVGCLAYADASSQILWTRTVAVDRGVHAVKNTGGSGSVFFNGPVGEGISSNGTQAAFTALLGNDTGIYQCDPSQPASSCSLRVVTGVGGGSKYLTTLPGQKVSYALFPNLIASNTANKDISTSSAIGPLTSTPLHLVYQRKPLGGPEMVVIDLANASSGAGGIGQVAPALAGSSISDVSYYPQVAEIHQVNGTSFSTLIGGLPAAPLRIAIDPSGADLFWAATEGSTSAIYRTAATGANQTTKLYATPLTVQCIVVGKDGVYWLSAGVPYKAHK